MKSRGFPLQDFFLRPPFVNDVSKFFVDGFRGIDSSPVNRGVQFITQDETKPPDRGPWNTELRLGAAGALDQRFFAGRIDDVRVSVRTKLLFHHQGVINSYSSSRPKLVGFFFVRSWLRNRKRLT